VRVEDKRQGPLKLHDLPSLQKLCGSRFSWPASKTLEVAQELYDGQGKKIITYPRAEVRTCATCRGTTPRRSRGIAKPQTRATKRCLRQETGHWGNSARHGISARSPDSPHCRILHFWFEAERRAGDLGKYWNERCAT
jgi:hypothetical protein